MRHSRQIALWLALAVVPRCGLASEPDRLAGFNGGRFGISISWGVWTILGKGESVIESDKLPAREYEKLLTLFKPGGFQADEWVGFVRAAGAKYLVVPAKGPDGLCLFQSKSTSYDVADATPFARDPLRLLSDAAQKQRIPLGIAYSLRDRHHPHARPGGDRPKYLAECLAQVEELTTDYGDLYGVWLEGLDDPALSDEELAKVVALIRKKQPAAVIVGVGRARKGLDVLSTPTDEVPAGQPFERLATIPPAVSGEAAGVRSLVADLARTASRGGNYRLVVQPRPDGLIPSDQVERLKEVGSWLDKNGAAIYRTLPGTIPARPWGVSTRSRSGDTVYLLVLDPGVPITIPQEPKKFEARLFHSTQALSVNPIADGFRIELPEALRTPNATVISIRPSP